MNKTLRLAVALALAVPPAALAEDAAPRIFTYELHAGNDAHEQADAWKRWAEDYSRGLRASLGTTFGARLSGRIVKGAPYSAEAVTEVNQTLGDGNVISRRTQGAIYRDGEGRTRQESAGDGKSPTVYIQDPVAKQSIVLSPGSKHAVVSELHAFDIGDFHRLKGLPTTAVVHGRNRQVVRVDDTEVRVEDGKVFVNGVETPEAQVKMTSKRGNEVRVENGQLLVNGKPLHIWAASQRRPGAPAQGPAGDAATPPAPGRVVVRTIESKEGADGVKREEVRVQVIRGDGGEVPPLPPVPPVPPVPPAPMAAPLPPMPPMPPMPGIQTLRFESTAKLGKGVTTNLGVRDFDGVRAEGRQTTWTIPAGEIGNRKPIDVVSESWYSPDLQVTVYSRYNDPRTGETVYRLSNIKRAEPAGDLFKVPDGVTVTDKAKVKVKVKEKAAG